MTGTEKSLNTIKAKMREQRIKDFSESEIDRVFKNVVSPIACKRGVKMLMEQGLTINKLYREV
jgi:hypothetical protein